MIAPRREDMGLGKSLVLVDWYEARSPNHTRGNVIWSGRRVVRASIINNANKEARKTK